MDPAHRLLGVRTWNAGLPRGLVAASRVSVARRMHRRASSRRLRRHRQSVTENEGYVFHKTDIQLKQDIENELRWDPKVNASQIGVSVDHGSVSLLGAVDTYAAKWAAEDATKRVSGVRTVAQDLTVKLEGFHHHTDAEIAEATLSALKWDVWVPETVRALVHHGRITLEGQVDENYQRESAERAVRHLTGVIGVTNSITLKPATTTAEVKDKVQAALRRQATADANTILVGTLGGAVTLSGKASSWHAVHDATAAAWAVPGVTSVVQNVVVSW
ncbi:MAG: BON domain-containing protein [Kofleriaceae bacterium]